MTTKSEKKQLSPRTERYYAQLEFSNGATADCKSGNLKRLLARIKNNFAGEVTDWEFIGGLQIVAFEVVDRWDTNPYKRCIVASKERGSAEA